MPYLPESEASKIVKDYVKFETEITVPYLQMLQELVSGKKEGKDISFEDLLKYESKIDELGTKIEPYKGHEDKRLKEYADEMDNLVSTALIQVYGARLILAKAALSIATAPETMEELQEALEKRFQKETETLNKVSEALQKYQR